MTAAASKSARSSEWRRRAIATAAVIAIIGATTALQPRALSAIASADVRPKVPELGLVAEQGLAIQIHLAAALTALAIGIVIMLRPKGVGLHKVLGWTWVAAMAVTAVSSLLIPSFMGSRFGFIHLLSGWAIIALPMAIAAIRRRDVAGHRRFMTGLFTGGLVLAGALTFIPGRLMWRVFFG